MTPKEYFNLVERVKLLQKGDLLRITSSTRHRSPFLTEGDVLLVYSVHDFSEYSEVDVKVDRPIHSAPEGFVKSKLYVDSPMFYVCALNLATDHFYELFYYTSKISPLETMVEIAYSQAESERQEVK